MADFNLPGLSSTNNIDVKGIIDKLVTVESKKLDRYERAKDQLDKEKSSWVTLGNKIGNLQKASEELHGFRSPFDDKIAVSGDESVLRATASRIAQPSVSTIRIDQIAKNERIISDPVNIKQTFEGMLLRIIVGEEELEVFFRGGTIEKLAETINKEAGDYLTAKIAKDTGDTAVLILEAKNTGDKNRIAVSDDTTLVLLKEIGLFEARPSFSIDTRMSSEKIFPLEGSTKFNVYEDALTLDPENSVEYILEKTVRSSPNLFLKVKMRAFDVEREEPEVKAPSWPNLKSIGEVTVRDVTIEGGQPVSKIERPEIIEEKPVIIDNSVIGLGDERGIKNIINIDQIDEEFREYTFRVTDIVPEGENVNRIFFVNKNTDRKVEYTEIAIEDVSIREGFSPKHLVQEGQDSIIEIDGVKVRRETNEYDNVIKGVKLELLGKSEQGVELTIDRDYEKITQKIVDMIQKYNDLMEYINEQTRIVPGRNLSEKNEFGVLSGDITVMGLKSKLQTIMMNPYPTDRGKELALLAQIGISMGSLGSNWEDIKGGYLQVDEDRFVEAFERYPGTIKQLFGADTNNDVAIDNGVAYVMDTTMKAYINPRNGIITNRVNRTENGIREQDERIDDWREHLEDYRKKLESDFTLMQQALHELEQSQKSIDNFSKQLNNK